MVAHNLPTQPTPFIGRATELAEITRLLVDPACHLLTLIGPGGIGKTRLALEAGAQMRQFPDGVFFVPLQPLSSAELFLTSLADALKYQFTVTTERETQLVGYLQAKSMLLILDNFEHIRDAAVLVSHLLMKAPKVKAVITSREALNLQEEWLYTVQGMSHEDDSAQDAVDLFAATARRLNPKFVLEAEKQDIMRVCGLVEGMPLALEMAAAWTRSLTCAEIADEIERGLDFLEARAQNVHPRHRNLRQLLDQAWVMLGEAEWTAFKRLSVFRGGFTREAAYSVAGASVTILASLVDKSWLRHHAIGRYDIHELLRQYGQQSLAELPEEEAQTRDRHCDFFVTYLEQLPIISDEERARILFELELDNIRRCWDHAVSRRMLAEIEKLCQPLWSMYDATGRFQEAEEGFAKAADALRTHDPDSEAEMVFAKILLIQGGICFSLVQLNAGEAVLHQCLTILNRHKDSPLLLHCLFKLVQNLLAQPDRISDIREIIEPIHTLALQSGDEAALCEITATQACICSMDGDHQRAWDLFQQTLLYSQKQGIEEEVASYKVHLCNEAKYLGWIDEANRYGTESLLMFQRLGVVWGIAGAKGNLASVAIYAGNYQHAKQLLLDALQYAQDHRLPMNQAVCLNGLAVLKFFQGQYEAAVELYHATFRYSVAFANPERGRLVEKLRTLLPADTFGAAAQRGKEIDFEVAIQRAIAELLLATQEQTATPTNTLTLTERELEILQLLSTGLSNREIARELVLALGTVKWYISDIFSKLGVSSRTQAIARARTLHLTD